MALLFYENTREVIMPKVILFCEKHQFTKIKYGKDNKLTCRPCAVERSRAWREKNKERYIQAGRALYIKRVNDINNDKELNPDFYKNRRSDVLCNIHNIYKIYAADNALICKGCKRDYSKKYIKERPGRLYGLTPEQFHQMFIDCDYKCEICGKPETRKSKGIVSRLCVDHVHDETKRVRGLLCFKCNTSIGKLGDDISFIEKALFYLKKSNPP